MLTWHLRYVWSSKTGQIGQLLRRGFEESPTGRGALFRLPQCCSGRIDCCSPAGRRERPPLPICLSWDRARVVGLGCARVAQRPGCVSVREAKARHARGSRGGHCLGTESGGRSQQRSGQPPVAPWGHGRQARGGLAGGGWHGLDSDRKTGGWWCGWWGVLEVRAAGDRLCRRQPGGAGGKSAGGWVGGARPPATH